MIHLPAALQSSWSIVPLTVTEWTHTHVCQLLEGSVVHPKAKALEVKPSALQLCIYSEWTVPRNPSHLQRQSQSAGRFCANPGPSSQNRPAKNWRWENIVHILIKLSVSMSINHYLKLSTREFHAPGHLTQKSDNCGATQLGWMWRKWAVN